MKQMTCAQMGGPCSAMITGNTPKEMVDNGMRHLKQDHPGMAKKMEGMSKEDGEKWMMEFEKKWKDAPDL